MSGPGFKHIYGPVPSRRLGRSLGIDLVPFKTCTYDCIYCQLGRTTRLTTERSEYVAVKDILTELKLKLAQGQKPDYISLAGSGEPALNLGIGLLLREIKKLTDIPLAVLTNGSLLYLKEVGQALKAADLVIPSLDAGDEESFRRVNRPHPAINFQAMVEGLVEFSRGFKGRIWLEVLLVKGLTGSREEVEKIAALAKAVNPERVQLNTVCRPPAEKAALPVWEEEMLALKKFFSLPVDLVGKPQSQSKELPQKEQAKAGELLTLLSRRPCTAADLALGLNLHGNEVIKLLDVLEAEKKIVPAENEGRIFYRITDLSQEKPG